MSSAGHRVGIRKGDLAGFHSIRVNAQWRLIFKWRDSDADEVALVDYHT